MKIYINENYEIKAINNSTDKNLSEVEIEREEFFGGFTDFMILNYCYKDDGNSVSIYPARNYSDIVEEEYRHKVNELIITVEDLKRENEILKNGLLMLLSEDQIMQLNF